jgi:hypothetical protein
MARHGDGILRGPALSKPIVRRTGGWLLTVLGILWGVYGAIHLLLGVARAIHGPERTAPLGVALSGAAIFAAGAVVAWGGRRLRRSGVRGGQGVEP